MASVEDWTPDPKTGKKRYRAHWRGPDGKPQSKVCRTEGEATRLGVKMEAAKLDGTYIDLSAGKKKLRDYGDEWVRIQVFDEGTRAGIESRLRVHVWPKLGHLELRQIKPTTVQAWLKGLKCAPSTAGLILGHLSAILSAAVDDGLIPKNPCSARSVKRPKSSTEKAKPFTEEQVLAIVEDHPRLYRALPVCASGLGQRQGECFAVAVSDVDFLGRWLYINRQIKLVRGKVVLALPKGGKKRRVPLPEWVGFALAEHLREFGTVDFPDIEIADGADNPGGFLFRTKANNPILRSVYNRYVWKPAIKAAGVDPSDHRNGMHRCRHTFASVLLSEGEDVAAVSEWLGHANPAITYGVYAHMMPKSEERTRNLIDAAFGSNGCITVAQQAPELG